MPDVRVEQSHASKLVDAKPGPPQEERGYVGKYQGQREAKSMSLINSVRVTTVKNLKLVIERSAWSALL